MLQTYSPVGTGVLLKPSKSETDYLVFRPNISSKAGIFFTPFFLEMISSAIVKWGGILVHAVVL